MVAIDFLSRTVRPQKGVKRPNIITNLILRLSLGLFASVLPLFLLRLIASFFLSEAFNVPNWQVNWATAFSGAFIIAITLSMMIAFVIQLVGITARSFRRYGRFAGRFCTVLITGLSFIFPYMVLMFASKPLILPMFIAACFIPVINFMVVSSATKYYLLHLRIYYDQIA